MAEKASLRMMSETTGPLSSQERSEVSVRGRTGTTSRDIEAEAVELGKFELDSLLVMYRHHFDLFMKGVIVYFTFNGVFAGIIFRAGLDASSKTSLSAFVMLMGLFCASGCLVARKWVDDCANRLFDVSTRLGIEPLSVIPAKLLIWLVFLVALVASVAGLVGVIAHLLWLQT